VQKLPVRLSKILFIAILALNSWNASADDVSDALAQARTVMGFCEVLSAGVGQCFNPNLGSTNDKVKQKFEDLATSVQAMEADVSSKNRAAISQDVDTIQSTLEGFATPSPFPANLECGTERECLEMGFAGNANYPACLPVNGDEHANAQYVALEQLLDVALPTLAKKMQALGGATFPNATP